MEICECNGDGATLIRDTIWEHFERHPHRVKRYTQSNHDQEKRFAKMGPPKLATEKY